MWDEGDEDTCGARELRLRCACANCQSEATGERILDPQAGPRRHHGHATCTSSATTASASTSPTATRPASFASASSSGRSRDRRARSAVARAPQHPRVPPRPDRPPRRSRAVRRRAARAELVQRPAVARRRHRRRRRPASSPPRCSAAAKSGLPAPRARRSRSTIRRRTRQHRIACGVALYQAMGIARDDKAGRYDAWLRNYALLRRAARRDRRVRPAPRPVRVRRRRRVARLRAHRRGRARHRRPARWRRSRPIPTRCARTCRSPRPTSILFGLALGHADDATRRRTGAARPANPSRPTSRSCVVLTLSRRRGRL